MSKLTFYRALLRFLLIALCLLISTQLSAQTRQVLFGIHTYAGEAGIQTFEEQTEFTVTLSLTFYNMCGVTPSDSSAFGWNSLDEDLATANDNGRVMMITLEPWCPQWDNLEFQRHPQAAQPEYDLARFTAGEYDAFLAEFFRHLDQSGTEVMLRFAHEQATPVGQVWWYPWQGCPECFKAAYAHVWAMAQVMQTSRISFIWSTIWLDQDATDLYYPGDEMVDYVGTTILNHGTAYPNASWHAFRDLVDPQYNAAVAKWGKPVVITEFSSSEYGGDKANWILEAMDDLANRYPAVIAAVWLETTDLKPTGLQDNGQDIYIDWRAASSAMSLAAMRAALHNPAF